MIFLKIIVSSVFLYGVFSFVNLDELFAIAKRVQPFYFLPTLTLILFNLYIDTYKLRIGICVFCNCRIRQMELVKIWLIGVFFGTYLPGGQVNHEITKVIKLRKYISYPHAISVIAMDKIAGFSGVGLATAVCLSMDQKVSNKYYLLSVCGFTMLAIIPIFSSLPLRLISFLKKKLSGKASKWLNEISEFFVLYNNKKKIVCMILCLAILVQFLGGILMVFFIARTFSVSVSFFTIGWIFGLVSIIQLLPITFAGLGIREASFTFFLRPYGVNTEEAVLIALGIFFISVFFGGVGGILQLMETRTGMTPMK